MTTMQRRPFDADGMPIIMDKAVYYFVYFEAGEIVPTIKGKAAVSMLYRYPVGRGLAWACGMNNRKEVLNRFITKKASTAKRVALKLARSNIQYRKKEIKQINHWIAKTQKEKL